MPSHPASAARRGAPLAFVLLVLVLRTAAPAGAQSAYLVKDINTVASGGPPSSYPHDFFAYQGQVFFAATDASGEEPWVTDGTANGTEILADACPGFCGSRPEFFAGLNGVVLFAADVAREKRCLWRSDGTRAGTFALTDVHGRCLALGQPDLGLPPQAARAGSSLYFFGCPTPASCALWVTDGTGGAGTTPVTTPRFPSAIDQLTAVRDQVYFRAPGPFGPEVWVGDQGDAFPLGGLPRFSEVSSLTAASDRLFFVAAETNGTVGLWVAAKRPEGIGARRVPLPGSLVPHAIVASVGSRVCFIGDDAAHGRQLWISDGTAAGTLLLTSFAPSQLEGVFAVEETFDPVTRDTRLVFVVSTLQALGLSLWSSSGAPASAVRLGEVAMPAPQPALFAAGKGILFLRKGPSGDGLLRLWTTDGTPEGTRFLAGRIYQWLGAAGSRQFFIVESPGRGFQVLSGDGLQAAIVTDLPPAPYQRPFPTVGPNLALLDGEIFFSFAANGYGYEPWKSKLDPVESRMVTAIARSEASSNPRELTPFGDRLLFTAFDGTSRQLWTSGGASASTSPLTAFDDNLVTGTAGEPSRLTAAGGLIFFWQDGHGEDDRALRLWRSDGTPGGTVRLHEFTDFGDFRNTGAPPAPLGNQVFFAARTDPGVAQLWASDGTPAGTRPVLDFPALSPLARLQILGAAGGRLLLAWNSTSPSVLYSTNGTPAGTAELLRGDFYAYAPANFFQTGPLVYLRLDRGASAELWKSDGTPAGTVLVAALAATNLVGLASNIYFFAGTTLYRSDGTGPGTVALKTFPPDPSGSPLVPSLTAFAGRLYFAADDEVHGSELWTSDGTAGGTVLLADLFPGPFSSHPDNLTVAGGRLFFTADDGAHGSELWESDGTAAGTRMVEDLAPGPSSSHPSLLSSAGNLLYFTADDGATGNELWALPLAAGGGCQPAPTRLCLAGGRFQVEVLWRDFQGNQGTGQAVPLTSETGGFWFFDPSNVEVVVKVLDARAVNDAFWVFYGALSSVEYTITVVDTATGLSRRYFNPAGQLASAGDTRGFGPQGAFNEAPPGRSAQPSVNSAAAPGGRAAAIAPCQPGPARLCLEDGRFAIEAAWKDFKGRSGSGTPVAVSGNTGYFWFFGPGSVEVILKVLDGRSVNGRFWLFYGALSNVEYTLTVTDTATGAVRTYHNPSGTFASVADITAF